MSHTSTHKAMLQGQTTVMWQQVVSLATLEYLEKFAETFFFRFTDETGRKLAKNPNKSQRMNLSPPFRLCNFQTDTLKMHCEWGYWHQSAPDPEVLKAPRQRHKQSEEELRVWKTPWQKQKSIQTGAFFSSFWTVFCVPANDPIKNWNVCYFFYILLILTWLCIKGL